MFIVAIGNAFDGLTIVGGFDSQDEAQMWAEKNTDDDWHVIPVSTKEEYENA